MGVPNHSAQPCFGPNLIPSGCLQIETDLMNKEQFHLFLSVCMSFHRQQKPLSKETDRT